MRQFDRRIARSRAKFSARSRQQPETAKLRRFFAVFVQPLHAEADSEQRHAFTDAIEDRIDPRLVECPCRAKMSDAWNDDADGPCEIVRHCGREDVRLNGRQRFSHRREIPGLVIDERDHNNPFVLGNIRASRLSFAHATRSARANALNTASIL